MRTLFFAVSALFATATVQAQEIDEFGIFDHVGVGIEVGTTGIGFEVGAPIGDYVQVRTGAAFFPKITVKDKDVNINISKPANWDLFVDNAAGGDQALKNFPGNVLIDGSFSSSTFKFLVDAFPFKSSSFHVTAGFYAGNSNVVDLYSTNNKDFLAAAYKYNNSTYKQDQAIGVKVGDYLLTPDASGVAEGYIKTKGFRPYVGVGFGRVVPKKTRLAFACDLGVQFWGKPEMYVKQASGDVKMEKKDFGDGNTKFYDTMSKITVYPCLNFRLTGRIF